MPSLKVIRPPEHPLRSRPGSSRHVPDSSPDLRHGMRRVGLFLLCAYRTLHFGDLSSGQPRFAMITLIVNSHTRLTYSVWQLNATHAPGSEGQGLSAARQSPAAEGQGRALPLQLFPRRTHLQTAVMHGVARSLLSVNLRGSLMAGRADAFVRRGRRRLMRCQRPHYTLLIRVRCIVRLAPPHHVLGMAAHFDLHLPPLPVVLLVRRVVADHVTVVDVREDPRVDACGL